jgi:hypothetical protein
LPRKPYDPLAVIPSPEAIRERLTETLTLAERLRVLLELAERLHLPVTTADRLLPAPRRRCPQLRGQGVTRQGSSDDLLSPEHVAVEVTGRG